MATLRDLVEGGAIAALDIELEDDEFQHRFIYGTTQVARFIERELPAMKSYYGTSQSPQSVVDALLAEYAAGLPIECPTHVKPFDRKCWHFAEGGVWYFSTSDVRIFGWFAKKDCFVAVHAEDAWGDLKKFDLYEGRRNQVIQFRNALDLDAPKFIEGNDPNAVLSNCIVAD